MSTCKVRGGGELEQETRSAGGVTLENHRVSGGGRAREDPKEKHVGWGKNLGCGQNCSRAPN